MDGLSEKAKRILTGKNCFKSIFKNKYLHILYDEDLNLTSIGWMLDDLKDHEVFLLEKVLNNKSRHYIWDNNIIYENNYIVIIYDNNKVNFLFKYIDITEYEIEILKKIFKE